MCFLHHGCGLEVASGGELQQALQAGCLPERLIFAGPGKSRDELDAALQASIREVHVESIDEARCLNGLAEANGQVANIGLRINPVGGSGGAMRMGGQASPFGIDEEGLANVLEELLSLKYLKIVGVHLFMGTQILDAEILIGQYQRALTIARSVAARLPHPLETVDFGGGPLITAGNGDVFAVKLDPNGGHMWSKQFGEQTAVRCGLRAGRQRQRDMLR